MRNNVMDLDQFDSKILCLLQNDASMGIEAIGEQVALSSASVHRRIKKLREQKVIQKEVSIIDAKKVGCGMTMIVSIEMERERLDLLQQFKNRIAQFPEVQQCYYVTGNADFVLIVKVRDLEHYEEFTQQAFFEHSNLKRFSTSVVMGEVKVGLTLPLSN